MRPTTDVQEVFRLAEQGLTASAISERTEIPRSTVRGWLRQSRGVVLEQRRSANRRLERTALCHERCVLASGIDEPAYAYLLGQYLGDGCVSPNAGGLKLRIVCCDAYPGIMDECSAAITSVVPGTRVGRIAKRGCTELHASSFHWACLLPHGPGRKHERRIELLPWQQAIALQRAPAWLVRGLIHSDGCRCLNRVTVRGREYAYVRYLFSNLSTDIQQLFLDACHQLGIAARANNRNSISVARRDAVARLDQLVGPKS